MPLDPDEEANAGKPEEQELDHSKVWPRQRKHESKVCQNQDALEQSCARESLVAVNVATSAEDSWRTCRSLSWMCGGARRLYCSDSTRDDSVSMPFCSCEILFPRRVTSDSILLRSPCSIVIGIRAVSPCRIGNAIAGPGSEIWQT
mmetsp:Transcript_39056/g.63071  ORF Transcript_39056/g.63071 Transcript_39056/m.63071 type:complete len:146 (-) Transcript_39056:2603-3040(-)